MTNTEDVDSKAILTVFCERLQSIRARADLLGIYVFYIF